MSETNLHTAYISFGSNKGNRLNYIIRSLKEIEIQIGRIEGVSSLYKTTSWGFDSSDFYNGCVVLKTNYLSDIVLKKLLFIENSLGRVKGESEEYIAREIDLDLLFFDELIISTKELIIPHPQIHKRNFVLFPMCDISPDFIHPKINVSIKKLLAKSEDNCEVKIIKNNKYYIPFWERYSFVSIEGNIGVGKTSLSKIFKSHFDIELLNENYNKNPFLKEFYSNPKDFSLKVENFFLTQRINQINEHFLISKKRKTIRDYWIGKSLVFAKNNLSNNSFKKYNENFIKLNRGIRIPEIIIFLKQNTSQLQKQIIERGRSFEKEISEDYLDSISNGYDIIFSDQHSFILIVLDPNEVLSLKNKIGQENLFRKIINL